MDHILSAAHRLSNLLKIPQIHKILKAVLMLLSLIWILLIYECTYLPQTITFMLTTLNSILLYTGKYSPRKYFTDLQTWLNLLVKIFTFFSNLMHYYVLNCLFHLGKFRRSSTSAKSVKIVPWRIFSHLKAQVSYHRSRKKPDLYLNIKHTWI